MRNRKLNLIMSVVLGGALIACSNVSTVKTTGDINLVLESHEIIRTDKAGPNIDYYFSKPTDVKSYPIVIIIGGSTDKEHLSSIADFHKYFSQQLVQNKLGAISVDGWGININQTNESEFMAHYTRSQILINYQQVINYIKKYPPVGWNGKLALLGVSEGGNIEIELNENKANDILATVIWSGAGDYNWSKELWENMQEVSKEIPVDCSSNDCQAIRNKQIYDKRMEYILKNPTPNQYFFNMTNMYMADALNYPTPDYAKMNGKFLIVSGAQDTLIASSDEFYRKAKQNNVDITYWRIESMDHLIRKRPDLMNNSFVWLSKELN